MSFEGDILNVLIASPGDVSEERDLLWDVMSQWSGLNGEEHRMVLLPKRWELDATPEAGDRPQAIINKQLVETADILVGVFWNRLGTPTGVAPSGTVEEIEEFIRNDKPVLLYFSERATNPGALDLKQQKNLRKFKKDIGKRALTDTFRELHELKEKALRHLTTTVRKLAAAARQPRTASGGARRTEAPVAPAAAANSARPRRSRTRQFETAEARPVTASPEITPPPERQPAVDVASFSATNLTNLAAVLLAEIEQEEREWSRLRWKTIYTIKLRDRVSEAVPAFVGDTLIKTLRTLGALLADQLLAGNPAAAGYFQNSHSFENVLEPAWFVDDVDRHGPAAARTGSGTSEPGGVSPISRNELARVLFCEILVQALIEFGRGARAKRTAQLTTLFGGDLAPLSRLVRELLVYNEMRQIDSVLLAACPDDATRASDDVLGFLWPDGRMCPPVLDYLIRWPNSMDVVVVTDDSASARFGGFGPFVDQPTYAEPYEAFTKAGRELGMNIVVAHYDDLELERRQAAAWISQGDGRWERRDRVYSEFFYDKFPSVIETKELRDKIAKDPRIQVWNKILFTDLLADKHKLSIVLEAKHVQCVGPTRRLELDASREAREAALADLDQGARLRGLERPADGRWIVVKPITGWRGTGVERLSEPQFLDYDFRQHPYDRFAGIVVQPFFESEVSVPELEIRGRHDVRVVFVGYEPVFGMIRELPPGVDVVAASLENVRKYGGRRRYFEVSQLNRRDATQLVNTVPRALGTTFGTTPAIYSVDFCWVSDGGKIVPLVIELNSKPAQVWEPDDPAGRYFVGKFLTAIVGELASFHDEPVSASQ